MGKHAYITCEAVFGILDREIGSEWLLLFAATVIENFLLDFTFHTCISQSINCTVLSIEKHTKAIWSSASVATSTCSKNQVDARVRKFSHKIWTFEVIK